MSIADANQMAGYLKFSLRREVGTLQDPDATIVGVDGPVALQKTVEEQIGKSQCFIIRNFLESPDRLLMTGSYAAER